MRNFVYPFLLAVCFIFAVFTGCKPSSKGNAEAKSTPTVIIKFADVGWDSIRFHNAVARFIIENAFGYGTEEISGSTPITYPALKQGDIDVLMEMWTDNVPTYKQDIANKEILEVSTNFDDDAQGVYVPRYVIEGDAKRGIKAVAPGLKTVRDLLKYKDVFSDPEEPLKGRLYGAVSGWNIDTVLFKKYTRYGLDRVFTYFSPGSDAALSAAFTSAYEKGLPMAGYYWEPTWLTGKYDLVRLTDDPADPAGFNEGIGDFPAVQVTICVNNDLPKKAPDVVRFLEKYKTSSALTALALAYMYDNKADYAVTAKWFLKNNPDVWSSWLDAKPMASVRSALK